MNTMKRLGIILAAVLICPAPFVGAAAPAADVDRAGSVAQRQLGAVPIFFEENLGQSAEQVRFLSRGQGYALFLTPSEVVLDLVGTPAGGRDVLRMRMLGGNRSPRIAGIDRLAGTSNFLVGRDRSKWRTGVPHVARVLYSEVYPGIDVIYYGNDGQLEYDFLVAPGADTRRIALGLDGAERVEVDAAGDLVMRVGASEVRLAKPIAYQDRDGVRDDVSARYVVDAARTVRFDLGAYDPSLPLVIDPVVTFSTYLGGSGNDYGRGIAVDADGYLYVAGHTPSPDFPIPGGTVAAEEEETESRAFISKLRLVPSMHGPVLSLVWTTMFGGTTEDQAWAMARDASGSLYLTGFTKSADFPVVNAFDDTYGGGLEGFDSFVAKLNSTGTELVYASYLSGTGDEYGTSITADASGNAYIVGHTLSADFPTMNALQPQLNQGPGAPAATPDAYVVKLGPAGEPIYSTYLGGTDLDEAHGIAVNAAGEAYVTGWTTSTDFPTQFAYQTDPGDGLNDVFVTKLAANGGAVVFSTYLAGASDDNAEDIALDAAGSVYITGFTTSDDYPLVNSIAGNMPGIDGVLTKLTFSGTAISLDYSTFFGGKGMDRGIGIAVDASGTVFVTGYTSSVDFPSVCAFQLPRAQGGDPPFDGFVMRFNAAGNGILYSSYLGGPDGNEIAYDIALDTRGAAYVTGYTQATTFPVMTPFQALQGGGRFDGFVAKISEAADTVGVYGASSFFLKNVNIQGAADLTAVYGSLPGAVPLAGDWNGDGTSGIAIYDPATSTFFLRNTASAGVADVTFVYGVGGVGYVPLAGDWDGDGVDTVGLYDPATSVFFLRNANAPGPADLTFPFGVPGQGYVPLTGAWNGGPADTVGLYHPATSTFFLKTTNAPGAADLAFVYGTPAPGLVPLAGDWNGDGFDSIGLYDPASGTFFLRYGNSGGSAEAMFVYGMPSMTPVAGDWNGH